VDHAFRLKATKNLRGFYGLKAKEMKDAQANWPAHRGKPETLGLLLSWGALRGFGAGEDRVVGIGTGEQDGKTDGGEHEEDRRPCGELGEEVCRSARSEGSLRSLAAKGSGEVGGFTLLKQDDADEEERDDNVQDNEKNDHRELLNLLGPESVDPREDVWIGAEEGT
jgi:hypothetical protein